jgi:hypothetical protein
VSFFPHVYYIRSLQKTSSQVKKGKKSEISIFIYLLLRNQDFSSPGGWEGICSHMVLGQCKVLLNYSFSGTE